MKRLFLGAVVALALPISFMTHGRKRHDASATCPQTVQGPVRLPADDAAHPYTLTSVEEWTWTSHLATEDGRAFGFTHAVYTALVRPDLSRPAVVPLQWSDTSVSDLGGRAHHFSGRAFAMAAATVVTNGFEFHFPNSHAVGGDGRDRIDALVDDGRARYRVELEAVSTKTPVVHAAGGLTCHYSRPRMRTHGTVTVGGQTLRVIGDTWFDHRYGDQRLELLATRDWTRMRIQLEGDRELDLLSLNRLDGTRVVRAALTHADCETTVYGPGELTLTTSRVWTPPGQTCRYPLGWDLRIPAARLNLHVEPVFDDQDVLVPGLDHYWRGAARVTGDRAGRADVELFGYCPW